MPATRTDAFSEADNSLATAAKALGHPARVAILKALAAREMCICGEIVEVLPLAQATVSQHLKALKDAGLIIGTVEGPRSCYCLNRPALQEAQAALQGLFADLLPDGSCC